ncbi:hypothetical protein NHX12_006437 [Muraenolepis orangiensis]|uniref:Reverse transcriptase domain-containing protein n=1 Tax=Muraenolepis orangiensis TaxID=630683 RepID=A0A9Q0DSJ7_9TELE|nr:hypothetical protein NHX12_006437 [Muraenolepis orangiensis]
MVNGDFAKLTRKHGIKISAGFACTVEEIGLAVGEKVGHGSIKSLARMNSAVVIFLDQVEKVNCVIETGITNGQRRVIHSLLSGTGQEITEPSQIRRRAVSFYSTLYTSEYEEGETLSEGFCNGLPQVSEEANSQLEGPLTIQELQTALQGMQGRRAPGIDGLSVEFYKAYWDVLSHDLLDVFNESLASGSMPVSCRRAVITLLPKKGNLQDIKNWRPVSLLCVDYKILSKALATRLGKAVEQVIHRDQTYCVPGRSMVDNVHLIRDVLEVSSSLGINTGLISLDQEKAFDRVEHSFLWKVMEKFGFSAGFIAKIKVLYNKIESVLKFNGGLCAPFRVCRGVRQGCALSGMLYALSLEPLLSKIRSKLQGLFLPGLNGNMVLSVYADDVVVFVRDQKDTDILVDIVRDFSSASAARVNWKKSEALAVGEWSGGLPVLPQSMVWKKDGFKYLGVFLGKEIVVLKNWEDVIEKIEGKLSKWKWLLPQMSFKEPLIHKARLDVSSSETPGLTVALCRSKTLCLQQLVDAVGPELSDAQALGSLLGLHSVRVAQRILQLWSQILCPEEKRLLRSYGQGRARPDPADPFPEIYLSPGLGELTGPLLQVSVIVAIVIFITMSFLAGASLRSHGQTQIVMTQSQLSTN